jgi:hypothetical protein
MVETLAIDRKSMDYRDQIRVLLWTLWGLTLALLVSAGLWAVLSATGDVVGARAARWMTLVVAILAAVDIGSIVVCIARRELK